MSEFNIRPNPTPRENRIAIFLLMFGMTMIFNLFLVWTGNILGSESSHFVFVIFHIMVSLGFYVFPILIAWQLPQMWIRITATIIFSIFCINSILSNLNLPTFYQLFLNPEKFEYFNF